jgi:hypothetical protein
VHTQIRQDPNVHLLWNAFHPVQTTSRVDSSYSSSTYAFRKDQSDDMRDSQRQSTTLALGGVSRASKAHRALIARRTAERDRERQRGVRCVSPIARVVCHYIEECGHCRDPCFSCQTDEQSSVTSHRPSPTLLSLFLFLLIPRRVGTH